MAIQFGSGVWSGFSTVTTPGACLYFIKQLLKSAGWVVRGSGDGLAAYSSSSDVISSGSSGAGGFYNASAWICLEDPAGLRELVLQLVTADVGTSSTISQVNYFYSKSAGFTFGSANATTAPTATDRQTIKSSKGFSWLSATPTNYIFGGADTQAPYGFWTASVDNGTTASTYDVRHAFAMIPTIDDGTDVDPVVFYAQGDVNSWSSGPDVSDGVIADTKTMRGFSPDGSTWSAISAAAYKTSGDLFPRNASGPAIPYLHCAQPICGSAATTFFVKGWCAWMAYVGEDYSSSGNPSNNQKRVVYNDTNGGTATLIRVAGCVLPWNGTVPTSGAAWTNAGTMKNWSDFMGATDSPPPTISNLDPAAGGTVRAQTVITFDVDDESGLALVAILASWTNPATGASVCEVVHDGDNFRGAYLSDANTRTTTATGYSFTVRRDGGWLASPTFEYLVIDADGSMGELEA